jgi:trk system potassium uptake protein TrkA
VFFVAATQDIRAVMKEMQKLEDPVKRVVIAGGGNIGYRLAQTLDDENQVKVIERDSKRARQISETLRNAIVLVGDAADEELLVEENIDSVDVFCALTNSEEANILSAMLAKRLGAHRVMALITRPAYGELMQSGPIDVAISPQTVTIGSLLAYVRRGDVVQVHSLRGGTAGADRNRCAGLREAERDAAANPLAAARHQHALAREIHRILQISVAAMQGARGALGKRAGLAG